MESTTPQEFIKKNLWVSLKNNEVEGGMNFRELKLTLTAWLQQE